MLKKVGRFISSNQLLDATKLHLVALSGGADSVCLLLMLKELNYNIEAIHCNFHLRGEESNRDEDFCRTLCSANNIPFHIVHFDTNAYAELHKISIEMAARELRYNYFEKLRKDIGAEDICVAHHRDDSVETLLINLVRGTGIHGLQGIKPVNGRIVRPLLCMGREDVEEWLNEREQDYVTDSTNLKDDVVRNKIRLNVLPLLREINPTVSENIAATAMRMVEAGRVFDDAIEKNIESVTIAKKEWTEIDINKLYNLKAPEYVLFSILSPLGFSPAQIESIHSQENWRTGSRWKSNTHEAAFDRGILLVRKRHDSVFEKLRIPETGNYTFIEKNGRELKLSIKEMIIENDFVVSKEPYRIHIDKSKVEFPLLLRKVKSGDSFVPFGMKGSKLVSDYLTDNKRNVFQKEEQLFLEDATGRCVWLVGERTDNRCRIDKNTIKCLEIRYSIE